MTNDELDALEKRARYKHTLFAEAYQPSHAMTFLECADTIASLRRQLAEKEAQLTAERERADKLAQEKYEWRSACMAHGDKANAAQAEARELREWADAMNTALDAFWNDPERPSLHRMRSETTSKICVLQEKHRTRIDAKLTEGA
jgi:hypothetical protein